jgi:hypothetical protein
MPNQDVVLEGGSIALLFWIPKGVRTLPAEGPTGVWLGTTATLNALAGNGTPIVGTDPSSHQVCAGLFSRRGLLLRLNSENEGRLRNAVFWTVTPLWASCKNRLFSILHSHCRENLKSYIALTGTAL